MAFLYYNLSSSLKLGGLVTSALTSATVNSSLKQLSDTATITIPREYRSAVIDGKKDTLERKNILDIIKVDDPVEIYLGYDGENELVFSGYIKKISSDIPLQIECEDEMYKLRKTTFNHSFESITVSELLKKIAPGYEYDIIDDISLGKFLISNASAFETLEALRKDYLLHSYFKDGKLVVGFPASLAPQVNHSIEINRMKSSSNLKFKRAEDQKLQIKAISNNSDGTKTVVTVGDSGGSTRTLNFANKSESELKEIAEKNLKSLNFDGYEGDFETFGTKNILTGDSVIIKDSEKRNSERTGNYLIESVIKKFTKSGYSQTIKPSLKL